MESRKLIHFLQEQMSNCEKITTIQIGADKNYSLLISRPN